MRPAATPTIRSRRRIISHSLTAIASCAGHSRCGGADGIYSQTNMRSSRPYRKSMPSILRALLSAITLLWLTVAATADELADFNAAVERASSHHRVVLGYLRTGNVDLAMLELERM